MKPDEHLPDIHDFRFMNHERVDESDDEDHDTPSPMEYRKYPRGRSIVSNKCSSQSSVQETPTKFPCIERNSRSVTSISSFQSATSHLTPGKSDLPSRHRLCRSPSCPNFQVNPRSGDTNENECRFPLLKTKTLSRHNTNVDIKKMSENHRRLMAMAVTAPRTGPPSTELDSPVKNAMLLPLRDSVTVPKPRKTLSDEAIHSPMSRKQDRKRKKTKQIQSDTAEKNVQEKECCAEELNLSQSDMKCLIWLAEVKASHPDAHEVT